MAHAPFHGATNETPFFLDSARKLFAHLLRLHPGPERLIVCTKIKAAGEIDKISGCGRTGYASMLSPKGAPQRRAKADRVRFVKRARAGSL